MYLKEKISLSSFIMLLSDRVGGRTCGQKLIAASGYDTWDMGGQWIGRYVLLTNNLNFLRVEMH